MPSSVSTLANAVRIERLSDDEDVDITDDLSEDERADTKTEVCGPEQQKETEFQPESPREEQTEVSLIGAECSHETEDQLYHSSPSLQSPQSSPPLVCTEEHGTTDKHEKAVKTGTSQEQKADAEGGQNCQCDISAQTDPSGEADRDTTGNPHRLFLIIICTI